MRIKIEEKLPKAFKKLVILHVLYMIFTNFPGIFVNTFLLSQSNEINIVLLFNFTFFLMGALFMYLSAWMLRRFNVVMVLTIGISSYMLLFILLLVLKENASHYFLLLGLIYGIGEGFYWICYNKLIIAYTGIENRSRCIGFMSAVSAAVTLIVPFLAGVIISKAGGLKGYLIVFAVSLVMAVLTVMFGFLLPNAGKDEMQVNYGKAFAVVKNHKCLSASLMSQAVKGIREGVFTFILSVILYSIIKNEMLIGFNTFLSGAATILSSVIMMKLVNKENRMKYMSVSVGVLILTNIIVIFWLDPLSVILFTIINSFFSVFMLNACYTTFLDSVSIVKGAMERQAEMVVFNESALISGRCVGVIVIVLANLLTHNNMTAQIIGLLLVTLTQIYAVSLGNKANSCKDILTCACAEDQKCSYSMK